MKQRLITILLTLSLLFTSSFAIMTTSVEVHAATPTTPTTPTPSPTGAAKPGTTATPKEGSVPVADDNSVPGYVLQKILAGVGNYVMTVASVWLRVAGTLLSMAMLMTLHIGELVNNNAGINLLWKTIRDFSSIFFIFMLLYASLRMILGYDGGNLKKLVVSIVVCGLLINFSLFITKVVIDASNVAALTFYNAITPGQQVDLKDPTRYFKWALNDQGLSDVFMDALKIQTIYDASAKIKSENVHMNIILATFLGAALMILAAINFTIAAVLFIVRIGILILLMVFSPIYFLGMVIPQAKTYSDQWRGMLISQATFAPIYLVMIYIAMKFISNPAFKAFMGGNDPSATFSNAILGTGSIGVVFQYGLAIILLSAALIAAKSGAGQFAKYGDKAGDYMKNAMKWTGGAARDMSGYNWVGRNVVGGGASKLDGALAGTRFGNSRMGRSIRESTTAKVAGMKVGGMSYKDDRKLSRDITEGTREREARKAFRSALQTKDVAKIGAALKGMSSSQKISLDHDRLLDKNVLKHLKASEFEAIYKRENNGKDDELSESEVDAIKKARTEALEEAIVDPNPKIGEEMVKNMSGKDLAKLADKNAALLTDPQLIVHLKNSQLREMEDLADPIKTAIASEIIHSMPGGKRHPAAGFIEKNDKIWKY